jgi:uncharacterized protein (DUF2225 family)
MADAVTFFTKNLIECPVCGYQFKREELMTGGGRLNAGKLTYELRRLYIPTQKWGKVNPLLYPVTVCPNCLYSTLKDDFGKYLDDNIISQIDRYREIRGNYAIQIVDKVDFEKPRDLKHALLSYILAISTYSFLSKKLSPSFKKAVCALRAAWLTEDLKSEEGNKPEYNQMQLVFYKKSLEFYSLFLEKQAKGEESIDGIKFFGPDLDKDFGFDGVLYIYAVLRYKLSYLEEDPRKRLEIIDESKRYIAKFVGIGKKSIDKPVDVLEMGRELYEKMSEEEEKLKKELEEFSVSFDSQQ